MKIPFNKPYLTGNELKYVEEAVSLGKISGNGEFTHLCQDFFERRYGFQKCLLTTSCTDALEMAAILFDIQPGDEVIIPSFTFVSTANAFVLRGAKIVFVDSRPDHPNMDERLIEELITPKTKAIVAVHYAGHACEMDLIMDIAKRYGLFVVEDAAQAIDSFYKGNSLGSIGHLGTMSFHETKNIQCGEGGMLMINDPGMIRRAEMIWEKGTERVAYARGEVDKYGWVDIGSSFLPSEITSAFLWAQLENLDKIQERRKAIWEDYFRIFSGDSDIPKVLNSNYVEIFKSLKFKIENSDSSLRLPAKEGGGFLADEAFSNNEPLSILHFKFPANYHLFYLLFPSLESRTAYAAALKEKGILAVFHYQSLHQSEYAKKHLPDQYKRQLPNSDRYSDCLLRLPMFYELPELADM
ncbi:dTDP-4-amino-4,6-dideoxygalactose transaminase [Algoriphagus sp. D3-2-R+10]|uniref:dTDP-4-amino-4,6-dideoxygalactose transaminase n=1 Tax=Algoriphagus aurantiacus TaxID=3103948 RepID=UPI002B3F0644|nr:dTDP-4-amino-4,6-dideoxygalactose transaminase [Algoriphagus sp. D3-2-R+10]MEB2777553.1 dTDP-4-amino-4,6-dideoxygalactose transaminase [Algoriphagus sp. D3-2-R+10]